VFRQWTVVFRQWDVVFRQWDVVFRQWDVVFRQWDLGSINCCKFLDKLTDHHHVRDFTAWS